MKTTLLKKQISGNRQSLFLDFYPPIPHPATGKPTRREFLNLYLYNEFEYKPQTKINNSGNTETNYIPVLNKKGELKRIILSPVEKEHNKRTLELAENIRSKRHLAIQEKRYDFLSDDKRSTDFVQYFREIKDKRKANDYDNWTTALKHFEKFTGGKLLMSSVTVNFCNEFRDYLLNAPNIRNKESKGKSTISQNSAVAYFARFAAILKQAYRAKVLPNDITEDEDFKRIEVKETHRNYLSLEELQILVKTECKYPTIKNAALFSALTGLRFSDIKKMTWAEVQYSEAQGYFLKFTQQKTDNIEEVPISAQAYNLLGEKGLPNERVFPALNYSSPVNARLKYWLLQAGIKKEITFHCFRHTYATLQLSLGTDIYTVSKMLGHRDLKTTQIYAKIVDEKKREAADKIVLDI